ncbi:hypothetical protein VII00023_22879 [Vibrio ichthyoenteri ATCC 700023]|uniref:Lipoprotein n=1 Tax=Vibrio ichthyoenteri ATCC 700023 TaxID=870968 RepID=F9S7I1_9VIBR|nr:hypothetical protein [Vibrio ichthyoenteri]EGU31277.1 hypothetical protein VII00023_22879 [Vibrio ichthyoenteri ATCC 700023]
MRKLSVALIVFGALSLTACGDETSTTAEAKQELTMKEKKKKILGEAKPNPTAPKLSEMSEKEKDEFIKRELEKIRNGN